MKERTAKSAAAVMVPVCVLQNRRRCGETFAAMIRGKLRQVGVSLASLRSVHQVHPTAHALMWHTDADTESET